MGGHRQLGPFRPELQLEVRSNPAEKRGRILIMETEIEAEFLDIDPNSFREILEEKGAKLAVSCKFLPKVIVEREKTFD
jgi:hypothetical protein